MFAAVPRCSYFCVTTNLSKGDPSVHRAGPLWLLVRASMTIVGLVPPVFYEGDLLIDGGWAQWKYIRLPAGCHVSIS